MTGSDLALTGKVHETFEECEMDLFEGNNLGSTRNFTSNSECELAEDSKKTLRK